MTLMEHYDLAITFISLCGWVTTIWLIVLKFIRSRSVTFEVIEEYDADENINRLILMARVVIRQSKGSYHSVDNGVPKD